MLFLPRCGTEEEGEVHDFVRDVVAGADLATDPGELEPLPAGYAPDNARPDQLEALDRANWYRYHSGVPPLDMIDAINKATQAHCDYYVKHISNYQSGYSPHDENPAWPEGFTGAAPWDRMGHFGYGDGAAEVIAFVHNATGAVDGWMNTLYHRIPFMDAGLTACGYGAAGSGTWESSTKIDTMDFGWSDASGRKFTGPSVEGIYPPPGFSGVPPSFDGMESPQPPTPSGGYPSGTIITVTWSETANFAVEVHEIWRDDTGDQLPHVWLDATNDANLAGANTIAMYANNPLDSGTKYWVHIKGKKNGADWDRTWFFYTEKY